MSLNIVSTFKILLVVFWVLNFLNNGSFCSLMCCFCCKVEWWTSLHSILYCELAGIDNVQGGKVFMA